MENSDPNSSLPFCFTLPDTSGGFWKLLRQVERRYRVHRGEDVVTMQQFGYVELLLAREAVAKNLRFRNLGWESDTVFEQRRDLNFPSWEQTLTKITAAVVVAQFGQTESLRGREALQLFKIAAEKLLARLAGTNRLVAVIAPTPFERPQGAQRSTQSVRASHSTSSSAPCWNQTVR